MFSEGISNKSDNDRLYHFWHFLWNLLQKPKIPCQKGSFIMMVIVFRFFDKKSRFGVGRGSKRRFGHTKGHDDFRVTSLNASKPKNVPVCLSLSGTKPFCVVCVYLKQIKRNFLFSLYTKIVHVVIFLFVDTYLSVIKVLPV